MNTILRTYPFIPKQREICTPFLMNIAHINTTFRSIPEQVEFVIRTAEYFWGSFLLSGK